MDTMFIYMLIGIPLIVEVVIITLPCCFRKKDIKKKNSYKESKIDKLNKLMKIFESGKIDRLEFLNRKKTILA